MVNLVKKNIEVRIFPGKMDCNDNGEKIASINKIESNIGIRRFIYNEELEFINNFKKMLIHYGYGDDIKIKVNDSSCSVILEMLRCEYSFLEKAESSSRQQAQRDLITAFNRYDDPYLKSAYPAYKTKKKTLKSTFRIINNNNNVRITKDKNGYDKIKLAKLGLVKFKTSKEYRELLRRGSDKNDFSVKIKHVTVKKVHGKYYAVFNIEYMYVPENIIGPLMQVGIDIGCGKLAVLSNGTEISNLDLTRETDDIIRHQKNMSHHKKGSIRYLQAQKLYNKAWEKFLNKRKDYYNKLANYIVKNSSFVGSNIMNTNMSNCNVSQSKFRNINFRRSSYADLNLSGSKFNLVTLGGVQFKNTSLGDEKEPIVFDKCDLECSTISNSNLKNIEIENCDIVGMKLNGILIENLLDLYNKVKS